MAELDLWNRIQKQNQEVQLEWREYEVRKAKAQHEAALRHEETQLVQERQQRQPRQLPQAPPARPPRRLTEGSLREQAAEQERFSHLEHSLLRGALGPDGHPQRASKPKLTHPERVNSAHKENRGKISLLPPSTAASCAPSRRGAAAPSESGFTTASERLRRPVHYSNLMSKGPTSQMDDFLNPVDGIRGAMRRAGVEPKNHLSEQKKLLADMAAQKQQQQQMEEEMRERATEQRQRLREQALAQGATRGASAGRRANKMPEPPPTASHPHEPGHVPQYLQRRKAEWASSAAELEARRKAEAECPPGLRIVGDEEKARILDKLAEERAKTAVELRQMPFVIKTQASQQKKDRLEARLEEIDGAVQAYSKDKVFVPADM